MLWMTVALLLIMVAAAMVVLYVAYPHRGEEMPYVPGLGTRMRRAVDALPTLENEDLHATGRRR